MKVLDAFRKLSLLLLLTSVLVGVVAMVKSSYVTGETYQSTSWNNGYWVACNAGLLTYCNGLQCMNIRDFIRAGQDEWNTVIAFSIIEMTLKGALLYVLFQRHNLESKLTSNLRTFRIVLISLITLALFCGGIAMGYADQYMLTSVNKALYSQRYRVEEGVSMLLMKISLGFSCGGFLIYCITWAIETCKDRKIKEIDDSYMPLSSAAPALMPAVVGSPAPIQVQQMAPLVQYVAAPQAPQSATTMGQQHVSIVIDGQTVSALLIPTESTPAVAPSSVVPGPIVYLPNASNSYVPPTPTGTSSSTAALSARPQSPVTLYPDIGSESFTA